MTTSFDSITKLSEQELLDHFTDLVDRDRRVTADLLIAIAEIDERKIWAKHACSSMFTFCVERFHMSEQVTAKRIWAARSARRFPIILRMVARGELHLGAIHLLAKHLTEENHARLLERAKYKSSRDVERLVAELAPRADVASRIRALPGPRGPAGLSGAAASNGPAENATPVDDVQTTGSDERPRVDSGGSGSGRQSLLPTAGSRPAKPIVPLSPRRFKIEITVDEATHDKLRSLQDLLGRTETGRDPAAIISRAIDVLLVRTLARKAGCTDRPRPATPTSKPMTATTRTAASQRRRRISRTAPAANAAKARREIAAATDPGAPQARCRIAPATDTASSQAQRRARTIPAAVRREVWRRDCGRCCYVDALGRRCRETSNVEFHHKSAFAIGGRHTPDNIELRCPAHNQYQADLDFGRAFMDSRRGKTSPTFPGECWRTAAVP